MCFFLRNELLECLACLILLRLANVSVPPLVGHVKSLSVDCLDSLHEILCGCGCDDVVLRMTQETLLKSHQLETLFIALGPLRDAWRRYQRKQVLLSQRILAAATCLSRRTWRLGFYSDVHERGLLWFHASCDHDFWSRMSTAVTALHENWSMSQEDFNVWQPVTVRKWRANVLQPEAGCGSGNEVA